MITATFNVSMIDTPIPQLSLTSNDGSVSSVGATNMTKVSNTSYTYSYIVTAGNATMTVGLHTAKSAATNVTITNTPTSGATFIVDNIIDLVLIYSFNINFKKLP